MQVVIRIENLYKEYRLGIIGHGTLYRDLQSWWATVRGKDDPNSLIGHTGNGPVKDHILALKDINLEIGKGEVLGIIGKNGAGKSTLLKILSRVTAPTSGVIKTKGNIASLLEVGTGFHSELTGRENIYLNGAINGMTKQEVTKKLDEIVDFSGVEQFLDTPIKRYSSGMHVRLGFSVAAHLDPDILVVDEVLAVGDASFQKKAVGKMQDVSKGEGRTVLFVSHNMNSILKLCNRAILLDKGEIINDGPVEETVDNYLISGKTVESEMAWEIPETAPGNDQVRLNYICFLSEDGVASSEHDLSKEIIIRARYWCLKDGEELCPSLLVINQRNIEILEHNPASEIDGDYRSTYEFRHKAGLYEVEVRIPSNFLNEGRYEIDFGFFGIEMMSEINNLPSFYVFDRSGIPTPDGHHPWRGVVRSNLIWSKKYLGKNYG